MNNLETTLHSLDDINPPENLNRSILLRIAKEQRRQVKRRFIFLSTISTVSFAGIITSIFSLTKQIIGSDFSEYVSLFATEKTAILSYWKEIGFSLVESIPLLGIAFLLSVISVFIWSGSKAIRDMGTMRIAI